MEPMYPLTIRVNESALETLDSLARIANIGADETNQLTATSMAALLIIEGLERKAPIQEQVFFREAVIRDMLDILRIIYDKLGPAGVGLEMIVRIDSVLEMAQRMEFE